MWHDLPQFAATAVTRALLLFAVQTGAIGLPRLVHNLVAEACQQGCRWLNCCVNLLAHQCCCSTQIPWHCPITSQAMQHCVVDDQSSVGMETPGVPPEAQEVLDQAKTLLDGAIHNNRKALRSHMDVAAEYLEEERFLEDRLTYIKARNAHFMPSVLGMKRNHHAYEQQVGASTPLTCSVL